ncbi:sigma-54 dependent transcriptional regulator [Agriterribacter sp.]|uniref:sigma-54-dependent transcriptional regulator n=1 Tax=Agriterribacter sp. TaxID=2821509 RepID=UPI002B7127CA|nr:sigma-54 dependent transcriptional regulator [Agriterribacter sp.]HTN07934.1 sigma-54 dependent transcriptional regulator [Agriterribacter sp.]
MTGNILIVDDEDQLRKLLARIISLEGFKVLQTATLKAANEVLMSQEVDVILCDVRLPDGNGVDFVKAVKHKYPSVEIILLTAYGNIADGVQAIKNGAFDYITKGDDNNRIVPLLYQAVDKSLLQQKSSVTISNTSPCDFGSIIGESTAIKMAVQLARKIAGSDATVLLLGETGTGKEVFANAIHQNSKRKNNSLVAINCSAFNKELLEGELFGHKAGAYTGAVKDKKGLIEVADGGTLFLDEIGELHIDLQAKLLRFLENGEFIKLGDTKISKANVRIIAATNRNLKNDVTEGHFREDLYYRLNVFIIEIPSLRERTEDIPLLIHYFLARIAEKENTPLIRAGKEALQLLQQYSWKGNIRELKNVLTRAVILVDGLEILPEHLPYEIQQQSQTTLPGLSLAAVEKQHIQKILQYTNGNKARAAKLLEIGLATLYRKMEEYAIAPGLSK